MYDKSHTLALLEYAPSGMDDTAASVRLPAAWTRFILYFHHICTVNFHNYFAPAQKSSAFASIFDRNHSDSCLAVSVSHSEYTGTAALLCLYVSPSRQYLALWAVSQNAIKRQRYCHSSAAMTSFISA